MFLDNYVGNAQLLSNNAEAIKFPAKSSNTLTKLLFILENCKITGMELSP